MPFFTSKLGQSGPRIVVSSDDQSQPKMSFTTPDYNQKYEINTKKIVVESFWTERAPKLRQIVIKNVAIYHGVAPALVFQFLCAHFHFFLFFVLFF